MSRQATYYYKIDPRYITSSLEILEKLFVIDTNPNLALQKFQIYLRLLKIDKRWVRYFNESKIYVVCGVVPSSSDIIKFDQFIGLLNSRLC